MLIRSLGASILTILCAAAQAPNITAVQIAPGCGACPGSPTLIGTTEGDIGLRWVDYEQPAILFIGTPRSQPLALPWWPNWYPGCALAVDPIVTFNHFGTFTLGWLPPPYSSGALRPIIPIGLSVALQSATGARWAYCMSAAWLVTFHG